MLISKRLILRPIEKEDLEEIRNWKNDPEIKRSLGGFSFGFSKKDIVDWYKGNKKNDYRWSITIKKTKRLIGFTGIYNIDNVNRNAEFGILIGDKKSYGKNYASEVTNTVLEYCFNELNLNKVYLEVLADNIPAIKVYKKNNFRIEGKLRKHIYRDGKYIDYYIMGILIHEYKKIF